MPSAAGRRCVVWCFGDGKRGHENQLRGLLMALAARLDVAAQWLSPLSAGKALRALFAGRYPETVPLGRPDLLVGAGHGTHLSVLAARRCFGGRAVILMRPSLPAGLFDLCVIPEHDSPRRGVKVVVTRGVLNAVQPGVEHDPKRGLILIGGPSLHHDWDAELMLMQITTICDADSDVEWTMTTSRRTPGDFLGEVRRLGFLNLETVSHEDTGPGWVPEHLARAGTVWVTEDSVSMVFEAITSGAAAGLLELPRQQTDRVTRGMDALVADGLLTRFSDWQPTEALRVEREPLNEAARVAGIIVQRWFND